MATGRGRLLQRHWLGLLELRLPLGGVGAAPETNGLRNRSGVQAAAPCILGGQHAQDEGPCRRPRPHCPAWLDSMPSEILLEILSYLDAAALLCVGCVNRRFYHLANDKYNWRVDSVQKTAESMNLLSVEDTEAGYWKKEYIMKRVSSLKEALAPVLKPINQHTGLPAKTKEALRISGLGWVIILKEKSGKEYVMEHADLFVNDSSVTIMWYSKNWPCLAPLSTLDLCGVTPLSGDWPRPPTKNVPRWCSLVARYSLRGVTDCPVMGCDHFVRIFRLDPGLLVGLWKRKEELAFVMANLHVHHLMERSILGSAVVPYELLPHARLLDYRPGYGLHGCQLHVDMHSRGVFYLCSTFHNLFTNKDNCICGPQWVNSARLFPSLLHGSIENGCVKLIVIHFQNSMEHLPLIGEVGLSWRSDTADGCIKSCSIMDVTLLDEYGKPVWCFSSPVCMRASPSPSDNPHFVGQTSCIDYEDATGAVHMELVWIKETQEHFIVSLVLYLRLAAPPTGVGCS